MLEALNACIANSPSVYSLQNVVQHSNLYLLFVWFGTRPYLTATYKHQLWASECLVPFNVILHNFSITWWWSSPYKALRMYYVPSLRRSDFHCSFIKWYVTETTYPWKYLAASSEPFHWYRPTSQCNFPLMLRASIKVLGVTKARIDPGYVP